MQADLIRGCRRLDSLTPVTAWGNLSPIQYGTAGSSGVRICVDHSLVR